MRRALGFILVIAGSTAFADRIDTHWYWPGCKVETGEELFYGSIHRSYPAMHLFDENPATAWVFSGISPKQKLAKNLISQEEAKPTYWIHIQPDRAITLDGFEIMNGYNKSRKAFLGNRRVVGLEVWNGDTWFDPKYGKKLKEARLTDRMGWHRVSLPKRRYEEGITLRFTDFAGSPYQDLALSGIRLLHNRKPVDLRPTKVVAFSEGSDCG